MSDAIFGHTETGKKVSSRRADVRGSECHQASHRIHDCHDVTIRYGTVPYRDDDFPFRLNDASGSSEQLKPASSHKGGSRSVNPLTGSLLQRCKSSHTYGDLPKRVSLSLKQCTLSSLIQYSLRGRVNMSGGPPPTGYFVLPEADMEGALTPDAELSADDVAEQMADVDDVDVDVDVDDEDDIDQDSPETGTPTVYSLVRYHKKGCSSLNSLLHRQDGAL